MRALRIILLATLTLFIKEIAAAPANDNIANATVLSGGSPDLIGDLTGATREDLESFYFPGSYPTIWYQWTPPATADVTFDPQRLQTSLLVFAGANTTNLQYFFGPSYSSNSVVTFRVVGGRSYYLAVSGPPGPINGRLTSEAVTAPPNDFKTDATLLTGTKVSATGTLLNSTTEIAEGGYGSIWYRWVAPGAGTLMYSLQESAAPNADGFHVYALPGAVVGPASRPVVGGDEVLFQVTRGFVMTNPIVHFNLTFVPVAGAPINDNFTNRTGLSGNFAITTTLDGSTQEPTDPTPEYPLSTWWEYTPSADGWLALETWPRGPAVILALAGTNASALTFIAGGGNPRSFRVTNGVPVQLELTGSRRESFEFKGQFFSSAVNDNLASAIQLQGSEFHRSTAVNYGATLEAGEPLMSANTSGKTIWWSWYPGKRGDAAVFINPQIWFEARVFTGTSISNLTQVAGPSTGDTLNFQADPQKVYHICVDSLASGNEALEQGAFMLLAENHVYPASTNDLFANALELTNSVSAQFSNFEAGRETGEPVHSAFVNGRSVWFKWRSQSGGRSVATASNSGGTNVAVVVYEGSSLGSLQRVPMVTDLRGVQGFDAVADRPYYIVIETPGNEEGYLSLQVSYGGPWGTNPAANLLVNGSFEADAWSEPGWTRTTGISVNTGEPAVDGTNFRILFGGVLSQDIPTVAGRSYELRLASWPIGLGADDISWMQISWGNSAPSTVWGNFGTWHRHQFTATGSTTRLSFTGGGRAIDAISVIDLSEPPFIVTQPANRGAIQGSDVAFTPAMRGSAPMTIQWFHNNAALPGQTNLALFLSGVTTNDAGSYYFTATNTFGSVRSDAATLTVEPADAPLILLQPAGQIALEGSFVSLIVVAAGASPLSYQWYHGASVIAGATNRSLVFESVVSTNAGSYSVRVSNPAGGNLSLPASLTVSPPGAYPSHVFVRNYNYLQGVVKPIYDIDGVSPLEGSNFRAQLYVGASAETLRPVGGPTVVSFGFFAGGLDISANLPGFAVDSQVTAQVRAWDSNRGATYEEARALGGKFGASALFSFVVPPQISLTELKLPAAFSLRAGLPEFNFATLEILGQTNNVVSVRLHGAAGFRYVVEKKSAGSDWLPFTVLNNTAGSVDFTDNSFQDAAIYRSRILE